MDNNAFEMINKYARQLALMESCDSSAGKIMVNLEGRYYETRDGADFANLTEGDVRTIDESEVNHPIEYNLLSGDNEIRAVVLSCTPYCRQAAKRGTPLTAALDDMAQIAGYRVLTVPYDEKAVNKALRKASGCFLKEKGVTITTGRDLYEAVVALTVLEKSAEVDLKAEILGGTRPLPKIEADLMRMIYRKKYSVAEREVKSREGRTQNE